MVYAEQPEPAETDTPAPCPLCGGTSLMYQDVSEFDDPVNYYVFCNSCGTTGPLVAGNRERVLHAWNLRTQVPRFWLDEERRGSKSVGEVGRKVPPAEAKPCPFCGHSELMFISELSPPYGEIDCRTCEGGVTVSTPNYDAVLDVWNTRSLQDA